MIFTAQWAKQEDVVYLRYDPNGGTPINRYPNDTGFPYKKNATAAVWSNTNEDGTAWFTRDGYKFIGWNTEPDGSGTAYAPDDPILLTAPLTTLYAQWEKDIHTLVLNKVDSDSKKPLAGAVFSLYCYVDGEFRFIETLTVGADGSISFTELQADMLYKLVEETAPNGYAIITKEIFFKLITEQGVVSFVFCNADGNITEAPAGVSGQYLTANKTITLTVENLHGYALPSTGGIGEYLYILCGLILISAPLVYGFSLRRRYERRLKS